MIKIKIIDEKRFNDIFKKYNISKSEIFILISNDKKLQKLLLCCDIISVNSTDNDFLYGDKMGYKKLDFLVGVENVEREATRKQKN